MLVKKRRKEGRKKDQVAPVSVSGQINFSFSFSHLQEDLITVICSYYCCKGQIRIYAKSIVYVAHGWTSDIFSPSGPNHSNTTVASCLIWVLILMTFILMSLKENDKFSLDDL